MTKKQFGAVSATTKSGKPTTEQVNMNHGFRGVAHSYDAKRPSRQVVSRYAK